jgi:hypothetical protein
MLGRCSDSTAHVGELCAHRCVGVRTSPGRCHCDTKACTGTSSALKPGPAESTRSALRLTCAQTLAELPRVGVCVVSIPKRTRTAAAGGSVAIGLLHGIRSPRMAGSVSTRGRECASRPTAYFDLGCRWQLLTVRGGDSDVVCHQRRLLSECESDRGAHLFGTVIDWFDSATLAVAAYIGAAIDIGPGVTCGGPGCHGS